MPTRMDVERANLLSVARALIQDIVQISTDRQRLVLDGVNSEISPLKSDHQAETTVQRFLIVVEHCLCHGLRKDLPAQDITPTEPSSSLEALRNSASVLRRATEHVVQTANSLLTIQPTFPNPWPVVLHMEQCHPVPDRISTSVLSISEIRTGLGRTRVWIRQALMQKELGIYFQRMVDSDSGASTAFSTSPTSLVVNGNSHKPDVFGTTLHSLYHPEALLLNDEGIVFVGLLVGLASVDFCFVIKDNLSEFDSGLQVIPYHIFIPTHRKPGDKKIIAENSDSVEGLTTVVEQKTFLEDQNQKLQRRLEQASDASRKQNESMRSLVASLDSLKLENQALRIMLSHLKKDASDGDNDSLLSTPNSTESSSANQNQLLDLEDELKRALNQVDEKTILADSLRNELSEMQSRSMQLSRQLANSQKLLDQKQLLIRQLEGKAKGMSNIVEQMRERIATLTNEKAESERVAGQLRVQLDDLQARTSKHQTAMQVQTDLCARLESQLAEQSAELNLLRVTANEMNSHRMKITELESEVRRWRTLCEEQETSLIEMAAVVNASKLEADQLRESHTALKEAQWTDDSSAPNCARCRAAFSVSRRRHHCRHCGLIFCNSCSSNTMPLPSSAKPVRVCDACHALLLQRYSAK